ncbi:Ig-like domain-containing protein [Microbacterium sp. G2-8]|uniref:Ig-like domain-containing protein n=1 Tax=Microbacterium sp. G2-8 TaxID=2842454 RepID=UPI001C8ADF31|nr:Ig-like domain-containing protein [Microbacterium sp. G2-8]
MTAMTWLRARKSTVAGAAIVVAGAVTLTGFAVAYDGNPTAEVELDDGSVWVTKTSSEVMGHLNTESALLDGQMRIESTDTIDIMQEGDDVLYLDHGSDQLSRVDAVSMVPGDETDVVAGSQVQRGGDTVAILGPDDGQLYVVPISELGTFDPEERDAAAEVSPDAALTVSADGTVHAFAPSDRTLTTIDTSSTGETVGEPETRTLENIEAGAAVQLTTVGETPVVFDESSGLVQSPEGLSTSIGSAEQVRLAADAASGRSVRLASASALIEVPLDGAEPTRVAAAAEGEAVEPLVVDGCAYAAWRGTNQVIRDCLGADDDLQKVVESAPAEASLVLRSNGDDVVLNDAAGGASWLASDEMQAVNNWDDLTPPEGDSRQSDETVETDLAEIQPPDRTQGNRAPIAEDDEYGVRAGRSAVLPVLDNDNDPDGDVLTIAVDEDPAIGSVEPIQDGRALQITLAPSETSGSATFRYTVDDGAGGSDSATVRIDVHPEEENAAPVQKELRPTVAVETGGSVTYNVLPDWIDPDGDDIYLAAVQPQEGDEVDFTADGQVTYRSLTPRQGPIDVQVTVSDGQDTGTGTLSLSVRPVGTVKPVTNADHVVMYAGETARVEPLVNDINAASESLGLSGVAPHAQVTTELDAQGEAFTVAGETPGTFYLDYTASAGMQSAAGLVRVDVLEREDTSDEPPVAVRDTAYLPAGGEVLIDVLQNDQDPSGGVLVVQSAAVQEAQGVSAAVLGQSTVQITDRAMLEEQAVITYNIHNGSKQATGEIIVIPVPPTDRARAPIAMNDSATVRAGDVVTIPVTDNDHHPNGESFSVDPEFVEQPSDEMGQIFVAQDDVRFRAAPDAQGQVRAIYTVVDAKGQEASAAVTIDIVPWNEEINSAPIPQTVTARTLAGSDARIEIPLDQIDPDGDSVDLVGPADASAKGRITEQGADYLTYAADRDATGVDTFQYRVVDTFGEEAIGTIRVGIAPPESINQAPNAMSDEVAMRPGRTVSIPVLANDTDPDGDRVGLVPDSIELVPDDADYSVETTSDRVLFTAPDREMTTQFQYTIEDEVGNPAKGVVQVTVGKDVPLELPIARDDRVLIDAVSGDFTAEIDLLANDEDPDGTVDDLTLDVASVEPLPGKGPGVVRASVEDRRQTIPYTVTDPDGGEATAFLIVPAKDDLRPVLKEGAHIEISDHHPSDPPVEIPLADYVEVAEGREPRVTSADSVTAKNSTGALVKDPQTLQYKPTHRLEGSADITFEVTDGDDPDDPDGRKSVLTIPITVSDPANEKPEFTNTSTTLGAGDDPVSVDLAQRSYDIDGDALTYSFSGPREFGGVTAKIEGDVLTVAADAESRGQSASFDILIDDQEAGTVDGQIHVTVSASNRPLPAANDDDLGRVHQGEPQEVPVLQNDSNPFEGEAPLRIIDAEVIEGEASVSFTDSGVTLTPNDGTSGYVTARYTIADVTDDADRYVQGAITATVLGVPDQPGTPSANDVGNREATLTWTAPTNNGAKITEYLVEDYLGSGYTETCTATVCHLTGLTNNREYQFRVTAVNEVGPSTASELSQVVRPDVKPQAPNPPQFTLEPGSRDQRLGIRWNTPENEGSPIKGYLVRLEGGGETRLVDALTDSTSTSHIFSGLKNGTQYRFQIAAINDADIRDPEGWSWSGWSAAEKPATVPSTPGKPSVERTDQPYGENEFRVTWGAPDSNGGDGISSWTIRVHHGDDVVDRISRPNEGRATTIVLANSPTEYRFSVVATNREGSSKASSASAPVRSYSPPGPVTDVSAKAGDGSIDVSWKKADPNGVRDGDVQYDYRLNGGSWAALPNGYRDQGGKAAATLPAQNGVDTVVSIRARTSIDGSNWKTGPAGTLDEPVRPFGPPPKPTITRWSGTTHAQNFGVDVTTQYNGRNIEYMRVRVTAANGKVFEETKGGNGNSAREPSISMRIDKLLPPATYATVETVIRNTEGQEATASAEYWVPRPEFTIDYRDTDTTRPSGNEFTLRWKNLAPPSQPWSGFMYQCQEKDPDSGEFRDAGSGYFGYESASGSGSDDIECLRNRQDPGTYRIAITHDYPQVPWGSRLTNEVTVKPTPQS